MSNETATILLTRPIEQARQDAVFFEKNNVQTMFAPMLEIEKILFQIADIDQYDTLIFTSMHGIYAFCDAYSQRDIQVLCVGKATARVAKNQGFQNVLHADGDVSSLIHMITNSNNLKSKRYLYLQGMHINQDLAQILKSHNIPCDNMIVYEAKLVENLTEDIQDALRNDDIDAISFMSVRTAENFVRLIRASNLKNALKTTKALCFSDSMLECVRVLEWESTHVYFTSENDTFKEFCLNILKSD